MARQAAGTKKQRDRLRTAMHGQGCTYEQIAAEMGRRFGFRLRQAWRHTHGRTQDEVADAYNRLLNNDQAPMTGKRISDFEAWPFGGVKPTPTTLAVLAKIYGTRPSQLVDLDDRHALSTQELLAVDTAQPSPSTPPVPPSPPPEDPANIKGSEKTAATRPIPVDIDHHTTRSGLDISVTLRQPYPTPGTSTPPAHRRWRIVLSVLLVVVVVVGSSVLAWVLMTDSHPFTSVDASSPSTDASASSAASIPPSAAKGSTAPLSPPAVQTVPTRPAQLPPPVHTRNPAPAQTPRPVLPEQPPPTAEPDPAPELEPPGVGARPFSTTGTWRNAQNGMCLDEQQEDIGHDPANIQVWDCNGTPNQIWSEQTIAANPGSIAKNLVSANTGRCITYQPGDYSDHAKVWLTPCGKNGQGWIRTTHGDTVTFEAGEVRGMCLSATPGPVLGNFTGIELRPCTTPSTLKNWQPY